MVSIEKILEDKKSEIEDLKSHPPDPGKRTRPRFSFLDALSKPGISVISEIKRSSPSTGPFGVDIHDLKQAYVVANVDAFSILTDRHFEMNAADLKELAADIKAPVLRKDFIMDEVQIDEAVEMGADAILLIATFLETDELDRLGAYAEKYGLDVLYEAHHEDDVQKIPTRAKIIGINNRNLSGGDYKTSLDFSMKLLNTLPENMIKVAESGYELPGSVPEGYDAVLVGTGLIRTFMARGSLPVLVDGLRIPKREI